MTRKFVLDTSLFVNPDARRWFGKDPKSAVISFIKKTRKSDAEFFMPPAIFEELKNFAGEGPTAELELHVKKKSPDIYSLYVPAAVFYDFVESMRMRFNKGLKLAEDAARDNDPDNAIKITKLRERYRAALRTGIVDSKEDFEIILLAKELNATIVSSDEGVLIFANDLGCEWLNASRFHLLLKTLASKKK